MLSSLQDKYMQDREQGWGERNFNTHRSCVYLLELHCNTRTFSQTSDQNNLTLGPLSLRNRTLLPVTMVEPTVEPKMKSREGPPSTEPIDKWGDVIKSLHRPCRLRASTVLLRSNVKHCATYAVFARNRKKKWEPKPTSAAAAAAATAAAAAPSVPSQHRVKSPPSALLPNY